MDIPVPDEIWKSLYAEATRAAPEAELVEEAAEAATTAVPVADATAELVVVLEDFFGTGVAMTKVARKEAAMIEKRMMKIDLFWWWKVRRWSL